MVNAASTAAQTLQGLLPLQIQFDQSKENWVYNAEKEKRIKLEDDLARSRLEYCELDERFERAESSRQGGERALAAAEKAKEESEALSEHRRCGLRTLSKQFRKSLEMLKEKARGTRAQAVRDFLASGSYAYAKVMAKSDDFSKGFKLAIDRLLNLEMLTPDFNSRGLVKMAQDAAGNPRTLVDPEDGLDMDTVMAEEFWPLVETEPESFDDTTTPQARTPSREYCPGWVPMLLGSIKLQPRGSSKDFSSLNEKLKQLEGPVC